MTHDVAAAAPIVWAALDSTACATWTRRQRGRPRFYRAISGTCRREWRLRGRLLQRPRTGLAVAGQLGGPKSPWLRPLRRKPGRAEPRPGRAQPGASGPLDAARCAHTLGLAGCCSGGLHPSRAAARTFTCIAVPTDSTPGRVQALSCLLKAVRRINGNALQLGLPLRSAVASHRLGHPGMHQKVGDGLAPLVVSRVVTPPALGDIGPGAQRTPARRLERGSGPCSLRRPGWVDHAVTRPRDGAATTCPLPGQAVGRPHVAERPLDLAVGHGTVGLAGAQLVSVRTQADRLGL